MRLVIVGVMPLFSILWIEAGDSPERRASSCNDQPRSARVLATLAPIAETVCSISEPKYGGVDVTLVDGMCTIGNREVKGFVSYRERIRPARRTSEVRHISGSAGRCA